MTTPFTNHIEQCAACSADPNEKTFKESGYKVCAEGGRLWRGDSVEMEAVNTLIQLRRRQYKLQRQLTDMAEASEEAALTEWPEIVG